CNAPSTPNNYALSLHDALPICTLALLGLAALAFFVLLAYVSSVLRFVLFDAVLAGNIRIREAWARRQSQGVRLFGFHLLLGLMEIEEHTSELQSPCNLVCRLLL